jgi:hypothetical protein
MHESTTRNIRKPGGVGNFNFSTFTQISNGLIGWSFEIPAYAYCQPLCDSQSARLVMKIEVFCYNNPAPKTPAVRGGRRKKKMR